MISNVVELSSIQAKSLDKKYKNQRYKLEYQVDNHQWKWTTYFTTISTFSDTAPTLAKAQKAAESNIDKTLKLRGK